MKRRTIFLTLAAALTIGLGGWMIAADDAGKIFNTQQNELGTLTGGVPGDQTGKEARIDNWPVYYCAPSYPWDFVLHCTREDVRECAVSLARAAAENENVGYDCGEYQNSLWDEAEKAGREIAAVETPCGASCATAVLTFYKCAGYLLDIPELQEIDTYKDVWDIDDQLEATGLFEKQNEDLHSPDNHQAGDIYVAESRHTVMQVTDGKNVKTADG